MINRKVFISGQIRSGTTLIGSVLAEVFKRHCYYEPFSPVHGIFESLSWYEVLKSEDKKVFIKFLTGKNGFKYNRKNDNVKERLKEYVGGVENLRYLSNIRLRSEYPSLIKDPIALFNAEFILDQGFELILTMKNIFQFIDSMNRVGWDIDIKEIKSYSDSYFKEMDLSQLDLSIRQDRIIFYWIVSILQINSLKNRATIIDSQSYLFRTNELFDDLFKILGLTNTSSKFKDKFFRSSSVILNHRTHNLKRNLEQIKVIKLNSKNHWDICNKCGDYLHIYSDLLRNYSL